MTRITHDWLRIDARAEVERIEHTIRTQVRSTLRRGGAVVGLSGGVDSSVVAALCAGALGPDRVLGLLMPERDSSPEALELGRRLAHHLRIEILTVDVGPALDALGCYEQQRSAIRDAIRGVVPEYGPGWRCEVAVPPLLAGDGLDASMLVVQSPEGRQSTHRMPGAAHRTLLAALHQKQRVRKMTEYFHADRLGYAVAGTPNRLEHDQGRIVKHGDASGDFKPIAHLYRSQVYTLAAYLGLPEEIRLRPASVDAGSLASAHPVASMPPAAMDLCLYAYENGYPEDEVATTLGSTLEQVQRVFREIEARRRTNRNLNLPALTIRAESRSTVGAR